MLLPLVTVSLIFLTSKTVGIACPKWGKDEGQPVQGVGSLWLGHMVKGRCGRKQGWKSWPIRWKADPSDENFMNCVRYFRFHTRWWDAVKGHYTGRKIIKSAWFKIPPWQQGIPWIKGWRDWRGELGYEAAMLIQAKYQWILPVPRIELPSPALQADSLSLSHQRSPKNDSRRSKKTRSGRHHHQACVVYMGLSLKKHGGTWGLCSTSFLPLKAPWIHEDTERINIQLGLKEWKWAKTEKKKKEREYSS